MLFDLRGRGRRRTVQVIYLGLALIFLLGFVGFGVGVGGGGGGLFNALTENKGSGSASFAGKVAAAQKRVNREPQNPKAWQALTEAQLRQSSEEQYLNQSGQYTSKGKQYLARVSHSWKTYLNLQAHSPSTTLAERMVSIYGEEGLNQPAEEVAALQIVIPTKPSSLALYEKLAAASYGAHDTNQGDLAARKAVSLAPESQRAKLKQALEEIKRNPNGTAEAGTTSGAAASSGATYTTTVNGKKTVLKASGSAPSKTSSTSSTKK